MRKCIIVGLLCLTVFMTAYVGGILTSIPQTTSQTINTSVKLANPNPVEVYPLGDEGGHGKPYSPPKT
jgi:hypothetical protein